MKAPSTPDTVTDSRAVANEPSKNGIAAPAVPLALDMNDDGIEEPHELYIEDDELWLHSDKQTLETFLKRKRDKYKGLSSQIDALLDEIEAAAKMVHEKTYTRIEKIPPRESKKTKGKFKDTRTIRPNETDRLEAIRQLTIIAGYLSRLNLLSSTVMKKKRPPSHNSVLDTEKVMGTDFCKKIVMEPLSLLPRDDSIKGTPPSEESQLYTQLTTRINYIRGHMLNEHLHGPGTNNNIVPISNAFNSTMKVTVEQATKDAVNANNKVVRFEAEAKDWGTYEGFYKGNFPDEKLLPAKFNFDVRQMKLKAGRDGSSIHDWEVTNTVIFSRELKHDPPAVADVKKGTLAPVEETFQPGYYLSATGQCQQVSATSYHLSGSYIVNGSAFKWLFRPLGLDPAALRTDKLELPVTTVFKVPLGYELVNVPEEDIEIIHDNSIIKKRTLDGCSFLIVKTAERMRNVEAYKEEVRNVKKAEELRKNEEAAKMSGTPRSQVFTTAADTMKAKNAHHQLVPEAGIRQTAKKLEAPLDAESKGKFADILESILRQAKTDWGKDQQLGSRNPEDLQKPYVAELAKQRDRLYQEQMSREAAAEMKAVVVELIEALKNRVREMLAGLQDPVQKEQFLVKAEEIQTFYIRYWTSPTEHFVPGQREGLLNSAVKRLDEALRRVQSPTALSPAPQSLKRKTEDTTVNEMNTDEEKEEVEDDNPQGNERYQKRQRPTPAPTPVPFNLPVGISGSPPRQPDIPRFKLPAHAQSPLLASDPAVKEHQS
ncbi:MAG TPA: hypothetical protein VGE90_16190 [Chitinophaga sp.]